MNSIYIEYDKGDYKFTRKRFPLSYPIIERKENRTIQTKENPDGFFENPKFIDSEFSVGRGDIYLCECYFNNIEYAILVDEVGCQEPMMRTKVNGRTVVFKCCLEHRGGKNEQV